LTTRNSQRSRTLCEPSNTAAANAVDSDAVLAPLKAARRPADARTRARRLRFVAPQHRLSPHRVHAVHTDAVVARRRRHCRGRLAVSVPRHAGVVVDNLKSQGRSRLASMPVRPQFNVNEFAAAGKQAERLRLKALAAKSVVELAREKTPPPPPPPPLKQ
jgi:hypothetical protein